MPQVQKVKKPVKDFEGRGLSGTRITVGHAFFLRAFGLAGKIVFGQVLILGMACSAWCQNLLVNGDFESGNVAFVSEYVFSLTNMGSVRTYDVQTNPVLDNRFGADFGDHTTGQGFMLVLNGSPNQNTVVWSEKVDVAPHHTYLFSGWSASWGTSGHSYDPSTAVLRVLINGQQCGADVQVPATNGVWQTFTTLWDSRGYTQAVVEIYDRNTAWYGNDFALDDLTFAPVSLSTQLKAVSLPNTRSTGSNKQLVWIGKQTNELLTAPGFGYALPGEVGLTHNIEASSDMIHWNVATNTGLYFKDYDSTNFSQRFYRFEPKP